MDDFDLLEAANYDRSFLEKSWEWLNDEEIKKLTMTPDFTKEDQEKWFLSLASKSDYFIWGILLNKERIGAFGIKNINKNKGEYWGYIGDKRQWGKGIGSWMIANSIKFAKELELESLYLKVAVANERAVKLYLKNHFSITSKENDIILMEYTIQ